MDIHTDATLDTIGTLCPVPIHLTSKKMKALKTGQILEVLSDDPGILHDLPAWCQTTGQTILASSQEGACYRFYLRKQVE